MLDYTNVSGQPIGTIFKSKSSPRRIFCLDCLTFEDWIDRLSRYLSKNPAFYAAKNPKRDYTSLTRRWKSKITQISNSYKLKERRIRVINCLVSYSDDLQFSRLIPAISVNVFLVSLTLHRIRMMVTFHTTCNSLLANHLIFLSNEL